jgi:hypothetical protein
MLNVASFFGCFSCDNAGREARATETKANRPLRIFRIMRDEIHRLLESYRSRKLIVYGVAFYS